MNRIVAVVLFLLVIVNGFTQTTQYAPQMPLDPDSKKITYREVVSQDGNKDILYDRGAEWLRSYYVNPGSVTKVQDKVNGKIEGTGRLRIYYVDDNNTRIDAGIILYDLSLEFKENRYRYTLTNFTVKAESRIPVEKWLNKSDPAYNPRWDSYLYQVDTIMHSLIVNLKAGMKPKVIKKDEW